MLDTKDAAGFLAPFTGLVRHVRTVPIAGTESAQDATALAGVAANVGLAALPAADVESAVIDLMATEAAPIRILICGSLYLAGQVLAQQDGVQAQAN
jgi:dihydrofolate synthase/folylpolyglutamate synthase